jgi:hypothetical protein
MNDIDLQNIIAIIQVLIGPISLSVALISLRSYLKFPNWRLFFLFAAFLSLSIPPTIRFVFAFFPVWSLIDIYYLSYLIASVLPFFLLAVVYSNERKTQSIVITRNQWIVGGLFILLEIGFILEVLIFDYGRYDYSAASGGATYLALIEFIIGSLGYLLLILTVISLFSYYRAKRTRNTLVVMIGFVCLLISHAYGVVNYVLLLVPLHDYNLEYWLVGSIELAGYIAFLAALIRLKVYR